MCSPLTIYKEKLSQGVIKQDLLQNGVILAFEDLYNDINKPNNRWFFKHKNTFIGLYIYGSVGRGKTFLMDLFVNTLKPGIVKRIHFHHFMLWLHQQLHSKKGQQNPIDLVIKQLSAKIRVLCLDEFLVHDITDAMLLAHLLLALEKYEISLVTTSNINPVNLYEGGLQRKKFLPAINWMQDNMQIMQLDGDYDYRTKLITNEKKWLSPINTNNKNTFEQLFSQVIATENLHLSPITINKRVLSVIKRSKSHVMFEFETLCKQPRNANDFIKLTQKYQSIFMVTNEAIEPDDRNTARRFITLIDVLYDANIPLYVLSVVDFNCLYMGEELAFEMQRTISRLMEMQNG